MKYNIIAVSFIVLVGYTDNLDPGAVDEAVALARANPPEGLTPKEAEELVRDAIDDVGEECPGCVARDRE